MNPRRTECPQGGACIDGKLLVENSVLHAGPRRDVKNEDRPGYMYENTREGTKCTPLKGRFVHKNAPIEQ